MAQTGKKCGTILNIGQIAKEELLWSVLNVDVVGFKNRLNQPLISTKVPESFWTKPHPQKKPRKAQKVKKKKKVPNFAKLKT